MNQAELVLLNFDLEDTKGKIKKLAEKITKFAEDNKKNSVDLRRLLNNRHSGGTNLERQQETLRLKELTVLNKVQLTSDTAEVAQLREKRDRIETEIFEKSRK